MQSPKTFQMILIGVFVVLLVLGFLGFSGKLDSILPTSKKDINYGEVTLWGTIPANAMQTLISSKLSANKSIVIKYTEKSMATFDTELVEALATGRGPDLVLLSQEGLIKNFNKLDPISYQTVTERSFKDTFLQEGEIFLRPEGIMALPFTVDPIVMYWNRDIFTNAGVVTPPVLWRQFDDLAPKISVSEKSGTITRSFVSLGGYRNISNAKEIISIFMMQAGSPIVTMQNGSLVASIIAPGSSGGENPVTSAIRFYAEFSKQDKGSYSWNSSLPESRVMFEVGDLAVYFGYASEYQAIRQRNPHLNFDVATVPQAENAPVKLTFGRIQGIAVTLASKNSQGALYGALLLSSADLVSGISAITNLPPARRDLVGLQPSRGSADAPPDSALSVFYNSAIISRAWYDPSPKETDALFMEMIESITSGRLSLLQALSVVQESMTRLLR